MQSKQNTDHTAGIFVDHAREGSRELLARILGHTLDFGVQAFRDQIVERFAENVALPELFRVALILEVKGAQKVLVAAALTYVAALAASVLQLLRLIILAGGRDRD